MCLHVFQWFPSKHGNLHICRQKTVPKHQVLRCFEFPYYFPKPLKIPLFTLFSSIFPCSTAAGQLKHRCKKSFQNNIFHSGFTMFPVKNTAIYAFFAIKSVQNTRFCMFFHGFPCSGIQKPFKASLVAMFFSFLVVFPLPEACQNDPKFHFNARIVQGHDFPPWDPSKRCFFHFSFPWRLPKIGNFK